MNDSIVNFYLEYCLTEYIKKELVANKLFVDAVENMMKKESALSAREQKLVRKYKSITNRFYVFSTFFYPKMREREFVLIPVITG